MLFKFEVVVKTTDSSKYRIAGSLVPEVIDNDLFEEVKDAYKQLMTSQDIDFNNHLIIDKDSISFVDIDIVTVSNVLSVLSSNLGFKINISVQENCTFTPKSCEPLFRMEVHRLFMQVQ